MSGINRCLVIKRNRKLSPCRHRCPTTRDRAERNTPFDSDRNSCSCQHYTVRNPRYCRSALLAPYQQQVLPRLQSRLSIHKRRRTKQNRPIDSELHHCTLQHYSFLKSDHQAVGTCPEPLGRCPVVAQSVIKPNRKLSPFRRHHYPTNMWISLGQYEQALPMHQNKLTQSYAITGSCHC